MIMERTKILRELRDKIFDKILMNLAENRGSRVKWLTALMDIDDEIEEMAEIQLKIN